MELTNLTITQARAGLQAKEFSCRELVSAHLERIQRLDGKLHAFLSVDAEGALAQAKAIDAHGDYARPLAGVPVALKDNLLVTGGPATAGSKILEGYRSPYDATVVSRLRSGGAVVLGKTNLDEFACGSSTENSAYGPTHNPYDLTRVPGGSSGGSAAAVAAGLAPYALGSDTGGSIRQPASLCGVVGLKPTYGRVSRYGLIAMASSLDQIGPFTRTVKDAALVLQAISGADGHDATVSSQAVPDYTAALGNGRLDGLRVGIPREYFQTKAVGAGIQPGVHAAISQTVEHLRSLGAEIDEGVSLPHVDYALAVYYVLMPSELSSNLGRFDGVRYGLSDRTGKTLIEDYARTRGKGFGAEIRRRVMLGTYALSAGYYDAYYRQAKKVQALVAQEFMAAFKRVDLLLTPTAPTVAFKMGEKTADPLTMYLSDIFTVSANIAGVPAISLPCANARPEGGEVELPVGAQLIGKPFDEATLLRVAHALEAALQYTRPKLAV